MKKLPVTRRTKRRIRQTLLLTVMTLTLGVSATAFFGGGHLHFGYIGPFIPAWFEDEPCLDPNTPVIVVDDLGGRQYTLDVSALAADGDPETYIKCELIADLNEIDCNAGVGGGEYISCIDTGGPHQIPRDGDIVYISFADLNDVNHDGFCSVVIGTGNRFGTADPKCRTSGGGDGDGDGDGDGGTPTCNASTAAATLSTGQQTSIASNACVRLRNENSWGTIDPQLQPLPGTAQYPVPFTATSCAGSAPGALTGDYNSVHLVDGAGAATNPVCDIFVQLQGSGSQVTFRYYE